MTRRSFYLGVQKTTAIFAMFNAITLMFVGNYEAVLGWLVVVLGYLSNKPRRVKDWPFGRFDFKDCRFVSEDPNRWSHN